MGEQLYLAASICTEAHRDYNEIIASFLRAYGFRVFMVQDQDEPQVMTPNGLTDVVRKGIHHSRVIVALIYGDEWDDATAREVDYAHQCDLKVIGLFHPDSHYAKSVQGGPIGGYTNRCGVLEQSKLLQQCSRTLAIPPDQEDLVNPLISFINLYYIQRL